MTRQELETQSTVELRRLARCHGHRGAAVASAKKDDLIALLLGEGSLPEATLDTASPAAATSSDGLADVIAAAISDKVKAGVDADQVKEIVHESFDDVKADLVSMFDAKVDSLALPTRVEIVKDGEPVKQMEGVQHKRMPDLLAFAQARDKDGHVPPIYLHGPAGTGKTTAARLLSEALGLDFYFNGAIDSEYKLSGFIDAAGTFQSRPFYEAYVNGGVYLFDELDSSMPSAVLAFNAALASGHADFPVGKVERHRDCIIIAAGNTSLRGDGHRDGYQRVEMDTAFRDRFIFLDWPLDETLEDACTPEGQKDWLETVRRVRANVKRHGIKKADVTPRATFTGVALLLAGVPRETVIDSTLRKALPDSQWAQASEGVR